MTNIALIFTDVSDAEKSRKLHNWFYTDRVIDAWYQGYGSSMTVNKMRNNSRVVKIILMGLQTTANKMLLLEYFLQHIPEKDIQMLDIIEVNGDKQTLELVSNGVKMTSFFEHLMKGGWQNFFDFNEMTQEQTTKLNNLMHSLIAKYV